MAFTNAKQNIPALFREIIRNQAEQEMLRSLPFVTFADAKHFRALRAEMDGYRVAAEHTLCWNTDKGSK